MTRRARDNFVLLTLLAWVVTLCIAADHGYHDGYKRGYATAIAERSK